MKTSKIIISLFLLLPLQNLNADADVDNKRQAEIEKWSESGIGVVNLILNETSDILTDIKGYTD